MSLDTSRRLQLEWRDLSDGASVDRPSAMATEMATSSAPAGCSGAQLAPDGNKTSAKPLEEQATSKAHQERLAASSTTPTSTNSTTSSHTSNSNSNSNHKATTSIGKFKEKRPEPLKLNPNLNQEIPLDLSVKR